MSNVKTVAYGWLDSDKVEAINVSSFGAFGNGNQDDTSAIQAAINAATSGGIIFFPAGTYIISTTLTLVSNVELTGAGWASIIKVGNSTNINAITLNSLSNVSIRNLKIDGNGANQSSGVGVNATSVTNLSISGCYIQNTFSKAIQGTALTNASIVGNTISGCGSPSIQVHGVSGSTVGLSIRDNSIDGSTSNASGIQVTSATNGNTISRVVIRGNDIVVGDAGGTDTLGIEIFNQSGGICRNFIIIGNTIQGENSTNTNVYGISCGGGVAGNTRDGTISDNCIMDCGKFSIEVIDSRSISVLSNSVRGCGRSKIGGSSREVSFFCNIFDGAVSGSNGNQHIEIDNSASQSGIVLSGNVMRQSNLYGIHFNGATGTSDFVISDNLIDGDSQAITNMAAIRIEGANNGSVHDNHLINFSGTNGRGLLITTTAGTDIGYWGNHFRNIALNNVLNQARASDTQENLLVGAVALPLTDGVTAPGTLSGYGSIYIDTADGDYKVIFGDGAKKTISVDATGAGTFTVTAAALTTVSDGRSTSNSQISFSPLNAAAGLLVRTKTCYVDAVAPGGFNFNVSATSAGAPAGTETFQYTVNPP